MSVCGKIVSSGPPSARHKDRNSFKFNGDGANTLSIAGVKLSDLYKSKATFTVQYRNSSQNIFTTLSLNTLKVRETTWLILNLPSARGSDEEQPTIRIQIRLDGPYRPEIQAVLNLGKVWLGVVDQAEGALAPIASKLPHPKYLLVPAVPVLTAILVVSPVLVGVLIMGLPFFLPLLVATLAIFLAGTGVLGLLYASTSKGREQLSSYILTPTLNTMLSTPSGQALVYETGPRPTPVSIAKLVLPTDMWGRLCISLIIDGIGSSSYLLPVVGEAFDIGWAPIQTILIMAMYDETTPNLKYVSFIEEILPFTDVVPSATIGWVAQFGPGLISSNSGKMGNGLASGTATPLSTSMTPLNTPATGISPTTVRR